MKFSTDALWFPLLHLEVPLLLYNLVEVTHLSGRILRKKMSTKRKMKIACESCHELSCAMPFWAFLLKCLHTGAPTVHFPSVSCFLPPSLQLTVYREHVL